MPLLCGKPLDLNLQNLINEKFREKINEDYLNCLRGANGIYVESPDFVEIPFEKVDDGFISFSSLFGVGSSNENFDLIKINESIGDDLNFLSDAVIIGDDPGGNFFVLKKNESDYYVFYWDRTHIHNASDSQKADIQEENECGNLYLISKDINSFLRIIEEHTKEMHRVIQDDWPS